MFDVQLTDSDTGADLTFGAHQVHLLAQVIKELPFSINSYYKKSSYQIYEICHVSVLKTFFVLSDSEEACYLQ